MSVRPNGRAGKGAPRGPNAPILFCLWGAKHRREESNVPGMRCARSVWSITANNADLYKQQL